MSPKELDIIYRLLFRLAFLTGELTGTISNDPEMKKWLFIGAKETRDKLLEIQNDFMKEMDYK